MPRAPLPLNALRAFEAAARHQSLTRAAIELCVTQAAVSHQVKLLEERLRVSLFKRLPRGLMLTAEGEALLPTLRDSFDRMANLLDRFDAGYVREVLSVGAVGTFAVGWLTPRLPHLRERHPHIELRLSTNNNRVDLAAEGLDYAIRFGGGAWHETRAERLFAAPLSVLCTPAIAAKLKAPQDVLNHTLLRSYRSDEWTGWLEAAGLPPDALPPQAMARAMMCDSSLVMIEAALQGAGIALAPPLMFERLLASGEIVQPFQIYVARGSYWLTSLQSRPETRAMRLFRDWLMEVAPV
jgi:LysR family transcriptional regulator of beta-lactamase